MNRRELAQFIYVILFPCCIALGSLATVNLYNATSNRRLRCRKIPNWNQYIASLALTSVMVQPANAFTVELVAYSPFQGLIHEYMGIHRLHFPRFEAEVRNKQAKPTLP